MRHDSYFVCKRIPGFVQMNEPVIHTEFLVRRITQLWAQAARLPERSPAQAHIEWLACELSDYVSGLNQRPSLQKPETAQADEAGATV
jgi:CelD/BcsL family acetyltransferase involved in cellulose biosynthesis